jgi:hypothetical protein
MSSNTFEAAAKGVVVEVQALIGGGQARCRGGDDGACLPACDRARATVAA